MGRYISASGRSFFFFSWRLLPTYCECRYVFAVRVSEMFEVGSFCIGIYVIH